MRKGLKNSLAKQSEGLPTVKPSNGKQKTPEPARHPSELPMPVRVKHVKHQLKQVKFDWKAKKHMNLAAGIKSRPIDVRLFFFIADQLGNFIVFLIHFYAGSREFVSAHRGGYCSIKDIEERESVCGIQNCPSAFVFNKAEFCVSCSCGLWALAKLEHKRKLAKLACPEGKYGKKKGWLGRFINYLPRKSSRESRKSKRQKR